ncbi:hypothetical protein K2Z83_06365 [Oscillochloris sp. ZM17-4]|uniref:LGFP repeat-containing protein n=1 Tax=Oscillochloris sp. ZM17-4 TaxID=2866714 RepID=UPI001C73CA6B|nr:hypothetical protein [Oscillochloris sp. ZM17-4]MBX0327301.1 hypothetical protein [Oscillochloris sp. ZM17-4]
MSQRRGRWTGALSLLALLLLLGALPPVASQAQAAKSYFPQTGHYVGGAFKDYWESRGGLAIFGYPVSEEFIQKSDGRVVQYFERARFEVVGTSAGLGLIGADYMRARGLGFPRVAATASTSAVRYFAETGHTLRGAFKGYWESRGGLAIFGFPLSEEITEQLDDGRNYTVQYFERARFELAGGQVRLGLLGSALVPCQRRPGLPPNSPPAGPVAEGNASECNAIPNAVASGRVYPSPSAPGAILGFEARGYLPNEPVSLWLNVPGGSTRGLPYQAIADSTGYVLIGFYTQSNEPTGQWSMVGQGTRSGRVVLAPFVLQW